VVEVNEEAAIESEVEDNEYSDVACLTEDCEEIYEQKQSDDDSVIIEDEKCVISPKKSKQSFSSFKLRDVLEDEEDDSESNNQNATNRVTQGVQVLDSDQEDDSIIIEEECCKSKKPLASARKVLSGLDDNVDALAKRVSGIEIRPSVKGSDAASGGNKLVAKTTSKKENLSKSSEIALVIKKPVVVEKEPDCDLDIPFSQRMKQRFENAAIFK
jgi:hypothetical protein